MKSAKFLEHLLLQNNCGGCFSSRTTACKENCPQPQKLILTQTLTPTRGQISSRAIVWLLPTLKLTLTLTKTPTLTRGQFSSGRRGGGNCPYTDCFCRFVFVIKTFKSIFFCFHILVEVN